MLKWGFKILICAVNAFIIAYIIPGVEIKDMFSALIVAVILSLLDAFVKPLLVLLTLPATIFSLASKMRFDPRQPRRDCWIRRGPPPC